MLSFEVQLEGAFTIKVLEQGFRKWMSAIEIDADKFDVRIIPDFDAEPNIGRLEVTYDGKQLFDVHFYRKYKKSENGKRSVCCSSESIPFDVVARHIQDEFHRVTE